MQIIAAYTREAYRTINHNLRQGIVTDQAAELVETLNTLPAAPGTTYRTFYVSEIDRYVGQLKQSPTLTFAAFTSTSRKQAVAAKFNGNVRMTIVGKTGRDIAPFSDAPAEAETLYLPGLLVRVKKLKTIKVGGKVWGIELEVYEL